jgi:signal transduction histidine kinase
LQLVQSARKIAAGNYGEPILVSQEIEEVAFIGAELERMRRRIEVSQERLKERLTESEQLRIESERLAAIGTLAASLAHEIRNPLNAMSLLLSRLQYSASTDTRTQIMGDLFGEVGRLDRLVSSILDYARPIAIERTAVQVRGVLESVVELFRGIAESKGVRFEVDASDGLMLQADPDRLKQCLVNLVKNSLDAIGTGGVIRMSAHETQDEFMIEVSDDGPGISSEIQAKLFSPFFTTKDHGTGLGLSSVHKIIAGHGGRVDVVSTPGKIVDGAVSRGAKFIIRIPTL